MALQPPPSKWSQFTNFSNASFVSVKDSVNSHVTEMRGFLPQMTRKQKITWGLVGGFILLGVILITVFHTQIVDYLKPVSQKIRDVPAGWVIPIVILIIISFPPLFGHEIVAIMCGIVYGMGVGCLIVFAGSLLGEIANFFVFRYFCAARSDKLVKTNLSYATLARVVVDGGFWMILLIRLSALPGHLSTPVFASLRQITFFVYVAAAFLSLPKNAVPVYVGVILNQSGKSSIVSDLVLVATLIVTIIIMIYIYKKIGQTKPIVAAEMEAAAAAQGVEQLNTEEGIGLMARGKGSYARLDDNRVPQPYGSRVAQYPRNAPYPEADIGSNSRGYNRPRHDRTISDMSASSYDDTERPYDPPFTAPIPQRPVGHLGGYYSQQNAPTYDEENEIFEAYDPPQSQTAPAHSAPSGSSYPYVPAQTAAQVPVLQQYPPVPAPQQYTTQAAPQQYSTQATPQQYSTQAAPQQYPAQAAPQQYAPTQTSMPMTMPEVQIPIAHAAAAMAPEISVTSPQTPVAPGASGGMPAALRPGSRSNSPSGAKPSE